MADDANYRDDAVNAALPARWTRDFVLPPYGRVDPRLSSPVYFGGPPQLTYPTGDPRTARGWVRGSNEPIDDGPGASAWSGRRSNRDSPAERGFISAVAGAPQGNLVAALGNVAGPAMADDAPRSPIPPWIPRNSRGEPYNLGDAPGQQITAAQVTPDRMRAMGQANAPSPPQRPAPTVEGYQNRGDWLDTNVMSRESGGRPNIGWRNTDLTPYLSAGKTIYGFPDWPGLPSGTFDSKTGRELPSTAAGLYGITKTNWKHYAPLLGVNDFSAQSQRKVADAIMADQGPKAWAASEPGYKSGMRSYAGAGGGGLGASLAALPSAGTGGDVAATAGPTAAGGNLARSLAGLNLTAQPEAQQPTAAAPMAAAPRPVSPLQPVPLPQAPNLHGGYQEALASILNGQRRGFGSVFG